MAMTTTARFLVLEHGFTPTTAKELVGKRAAIVQHGQQLRSCLYYIADQLMQAERENWPIDRCY